MAITKRRKYPYDESFGIHIKRWYAPDRYAIVQRAQKGIPERVLLVYGLVGGKWKQIEENEEALAERAALLRAQQKSAQTVTKRRKEPADTVTKRRKEPADTVTRPMYTDPQYLAAVQSGWVFRSAPNPDRFRYVWAKNPNRTGLQERQNGSKWKLVAVVGYDRRAGKSYWHKPGKPGERSRIELPFASMPKGEPWEREVERVRAYLANEASEQERKGTDELLSAEGARVAARGKKTRAGWGGLFGTKVVRRGEQIAGPTDAQLLGGVLAAGTLFATGSPTAAVAAAAAPQLIDKASEGDAESIKQLSASVGVDAEAEIELAAKLSAGGEDTIDVEGTFRPAKDPKNSAKAAETIVSRAAAGDKEALGVVQKTQAEGGAGAELLQKAEQKFKLILSIVKSLTVPRGTTGEGHIVSGSAIFPNVAAKNLGGSPSYLVLENGRVKFGAWSLTQ